VPLPRLAITLGDPAGIGPEVVRKALKDKTLYKFCRPLIIGNLSDAGARHASPLERIRPGVPSAVSGVLSYLNVKKSIELALSGKVQGVVHAPISKAAWKKAGVLYPGHTELIAELCGTKKFAMAIASGPIRTIMVTRHIPLAAVPGSIRKDEILNCVRLSLDWMKQLKIRSPKIAVCALNPHAGESGLIGQEEIRIIAPAIKEARKKFGERVSGPLPADSAFKDLKAGRLDCLVTLYHDQSLIPAKLYDASRVVNLTLGLPFPRVSPGHGTAFDIAGKNKADPQPMIEAILTCAKLCS
jgi:4-hydroxythreonine-4-phosphate dehydrogenase